MAAATIAAVAAGAPRFSERTFRKGNGKPLPSTPSGTMVMMRLPIPTRAAAFGLRLMRKRWLRRSNDPGLNGSFSYTHHNGQP